ncbi:uncharacterized protein SPSK_02076 [Sporothrix schenckii 1099-18]|uniref:Uncharacterized protein n=1 Tax=Sporothrix schenckii 1099-18 TaxID=1397361 RepID=A0A0F2MCP4_SPOSC|nr:uncharacterized protein SPSK_02076 [Sporothrix schenckii 1099-18]KJR87443.1 hypothetical protein SPSK_02076 [Sporothrix schenckii 1099-18]
MSNRRRAHGLILLAQIPSRPEEIEEKQSWWDEDEDEDTYFESLSNSIQRASWVHPTRKLETTLEMSPGVQAVTSELINPTRVDISAQLLSQHSL